ncbi:PilC/PilY family type IV pilus protein [Aquabacterium sp. A7-Y]|uniref:pilus assembly protein n=1 Tax=Aquabacterium sp. A7-Y TaxID=1349605 RepID=UPI00223CFF58|nr:PilC/PilY family type IV pilus protein [Aquabacterium sp. A7-Y]MCW7539431.1 PilC/PilY family type IV pilus protein [Aquabacterium sp. A7-Y]
MIRWNFFGAALRRAGTLALLTTACSAAVAEDIDIFAGNNGTSDLPNVLLVLDNSANWSSSLDVPDCSYVDGSGAPKANNPGKEQGKKIAIEKCALYNVIHQLPVGASGEALFNLGMLYLNSPSANGAYPRHRFVPLDAAGKTLLKDVIRNTMISNDADQSNNADLARALWEAFLWYGGRAPLYGKAQSNPSRVRYDTQAFNSAGRYISPAASSCAKNYVILLTNGSPQSAESDIGELLANAGANVTPLLYPNSEVSVNDQNNWADETARYLSSVDVSARDGRQPIVTYGIAVMSASPSTAETKYGNFIERIARAGGGLYYSASNVNALTEALKNVFNNIQSVNSVFSAANLPVSVNTQGTFENQVFLGVFKPDAEGQPRWVGNLKQYQFAYNGEVLKLVDSRGTDAVLPDTEFVNPAAQSFWTTSSTFWANDPQGTPPSASDSPDGSVVAKGGHAQRLRTVYSTSQAARKVYTCIDCSPNTALGDSTATRFSSDNSLLTAGLLNAGDATDRSAVIDWIRGTDNHEDERGPGGDVTVRPSVHADVLHSRPAVVNYGGDSSTVVVFYGTNDGLLKAVRGNQTGAQAGDELWSFVPQEFLGKLRRQRDNLPEVRYHTTPAAITTARPRDYFVDGPITAYKARDGKVYLYATMRRGGRFIYAFDVTDPARPVFLWKKSSADITSMGQTWSEIRVVRLKGRTTPVLLMGGGYDAAAEDCETGSCPAVTMGNSLIALDAVSGAVVKTFTSGIDRPVTGAVAVIDTDRDGLADRGYFTDLGGNIYRADFTAESATQNSGEAWTMYKVAALEGKMFFGPDVLSVTVGTQRAVALMVGTGDREKPWLTTSTDRFYVVLDTNQSAAVPANHVPLALSDLVTQQNFASTSQPRGCYLPLEAGEKVISGATTLAGQTFFNTNKPTPPSPNSCTGSLGVARGYSMPLVCGAPTSSEFAGGGLPPSPVGGIVAVVNSQSGQVERVPFIISGGGNTSSGKISPVAGRKLPVPGLEPRKRRYWHTDTPR